LHGKWSFLERAYLEALGIGNIGFLANARKMDEAFELAAIVNCYFSMILKQAKMMRRK
jgi:hypothetical protein